ncbi:MAG TPA: ATP-binding protein [Phycisphaerales bacterium]|nr:ATP-binding protein [Phycisphaerales bacterium]
MTRRRSQSAGGGRGDAVPASDSHDRLRERVKELTCLYEVTLAFVEHRADLSGCFRRIVSILPGAWRFPDEAYAALGIDGVEERTPGFPAAAANALSSDIVVAGRKRGEVRVAYGRAGADEGLFLPEERSLLDAVARQVAVFVERAEAEERRAAAEAQLRHADRLATIGQLAAGVAHELNEPLGNILGFAQLALRGERLPEEARADLDKIVRASLHGREVIRKLLAFAHQGPASRQRLSLNALVEEVVFLMEAGCEQPGIRFVQRLAPDLPEIEADPVQVRQVLVNLVVNAMHAASAGGGVITVSTERGPEEVALGVEDTGCGMPEEVARHAFDPFFTTKEVGRGTGLGLSVVQGIVAGHGGAIEVRSEPGRGSRFTVRLPMVARAPRDEAACIQTP